MIEAGKRDPNIRALAGQIIDDGRNQDFMKSLEIIFLWLKSNIKYISDINHVETFQEPHITLWRIGGGDCDDLTILSGAMLESVGYPTRLIVLTKDKIPFHIYLKAGFPAGLIRPLGWIDFDVSNKNIDFGQSYKKWLKQQAAKK